MKTHTTRFDSYQIQRESDGKWYVGYKDISGTTPAEAVYLNEKHGAMYAPEYSNFQEVWSVDRTQAKVIASWNTNDLPIKFWISKEYKDYHVSIGDTWLTEENGYGETFKMHQVFIHLYWKQYDEN